MTQATRFIQILALALGLSGLVAHAQQRGAGNPLPPALQAAVQSGNPRAISQAIAALSGGNPTVTAAVSAQAVTVAERVLSTNPAVAVQLAPTAAAAVTGLVTAASTNTALTQIDPTLASQLTPTQTPADKGTPSPVDSTPRTDIDTTTRSGSS